MEEKKEDSCIVEILQMREKGNRLYQAGNYNEAIDVWFESLKSSLKSSVRFASPKLYENQFLCRLNLAMAYLKLENWIDAKEQSQLVLEQQPRNVKALLRLARAYEGLQESDKCLELIQTIVQCVKDFENNTDTQESCQKSIISDQYESLDAVHMFGLSPDYVRNYVNVLKRRIVKEEKMYWRRKTKMLQTIGSRLYDTGAACEGNEFVDKSLRVYPKEEINKEKFFLSLTSDQIILWTHQAEISGHVNFSLCRLNLDAPLIKGLYFVEKEGLFKDDSITLENNIDDPNNSLWTRIYMNKDKISSCIYPVSLPFSILYIISLILGRSPHSLQGDPRPMFSLDDWLGYDPESLLKKSLVDAMIYRHQLTFFIVGAKCFEVVNCHWTSILRRLNMVTILNIVFIGFTEDDEAWERGLGYENLYTSSLKITEQKTQQVNGFFYKTSCHNFLSSHSEVLTDKSHPLHPDFVCLIEHDLENNKAGEGVSEIDQLDVHNIPVFIVSSGCIQENPPNDFFSNRACKNVKFQWIIPFQKNPYCVKENVDDESFNSSSLENPAQENKHFSNISILNAAVGCIMISLGA